jgi:hypothetical protein
VAAQLGFKRRVRLYDAAPERVRTARLSPLFLPIGVYWAVCAALCYAVLSGSLPVGRLFDSEPAKERKSARRSPARRVRARPATPPPPSEPLELPIAREPVAEPASYVEPAPLAPTPNRAPVSDLAPPAVTADRVAERSTPERRARQTEPLATLSMDRAALDRDLIPNPKPKPETAPPSEAPAGPSFGSCEAAIENNSESIDLQKGRLPPDLPRSSYASVLERGDYFSHCGVPDDMAIEICAAVRNGRAVGITIVTRPASARVRNCVTSAVRSLRFPAHPRLDVTRTRFDALR